MLLNQQKNVIKLTRGMMLETMPLIILCQEDLGAEFAGRVTGFEGLGSTGKSLLAVSVIKDPQLEMCVVIDTEGGGNSQELMEFAGVDLKNNKEFF